MKSNDRPVNHPGNPGSKTSLKPDEALQDPVLEQALRNFRISVHAWSEATYSRPRSAIVLTSRKSARRLATTWALGCVLAAGIAGGGIHERHQRQELARIAAQREAEHQRQLAQERARDAEDLLAKVDSDVSQEVPDAMQPLARLMDESR